jgi:hypothetical protein
MRLTFVSEKLPKLCLIICVHVIIWWVVAPYSLGRNFLRPFLELRCIQELVRSYWRVAKKDPYTRLHGVTTQKTTI